MLRNTPALSGAPPGLPTFPEGLTESWETEMLALVTEAVVFTVNVVVGVVTVAGVVGVTLMLFFVNVAVLMELLPALSTPVAVIV